MFIALAIIGILTALAVVPVNTTPLPADPHPAVDYARAVAMYDSLSETERDVIMPDAGSFMLVHGHRTPRVVVLVHGMTNSPRQFRELGEAFYERGYNVIAPRMPEHGYKDADVAALKRLTAEKYRDYADRAVDIAAGLGDSVFVMGFSAGGNVAAWIAQHRGDVMRVVVIAPAVALERLPRLLAAPAMNLFERVPNLTFRHKPDAAASHAYSGVSTRGVAETLRFGASIMEQADQSAPRVRDLAMVTNDNDRTVDGDAASRLADRWSETDSIATARFTFDRSLALPHDVIDATEPCGMTAVVYPVLIALMERTTPPPVKVERPRC